MKKMLNKNTVGWKCEIRSVFNEKLKSKGSSIKMWNKKSVWSKCEINSGFFQKIAKWKGCSIKIALYQNP